MGHMSQIGLCNSAYMHTQLYIYTIYICIMYIHYTYVYNKYVWYSSKTDGTYTVYIRNTNYDTINIPNAGIAIPFLLGPVLIILSRRYCYSLPIGSCTNTGTGLYSLLPCTHVFTHTRVYYR